MAGILPCPAFTTTTPPLAISTIRLRRRSRPTQARLPAFLAAFWLAVGAPLAVVHAHGGAESEAGFDNVQVLDPALEGRISVTRVGSERTDTGLLSIFADLKNLTGRPVTIEAQTLYRDSSGNWLDGGRAGWLSLQIKPHEEFEYRSASLSQEAEDFLVRIRRAG